MHNYYDEPKGDIVQVISFCFVLFFSLCLWYIIFQSNYMMGLLLLTVAGLAQSVERLTAEREVEGSIPGAGPLLRVLK